LQAHRPPPRLFYWMQVASAHLRKQANLGLESRGLTATQLGAMYALAEQPTGVPLKQLARTLRVRPSAVTTLSRRLQRDGYATASPSEEDARVSLLRLTDHGRQSLKEATPLLNAFNDALTAQFSEDELAVVHRFLSTCASLRVEVPDGA